MRMYRLGKLARTSALPFALCLAPVLVFAIGVWIIPEKGTAASVGSTRHTWFESMYEAGSKRISSVVGPSSSPSGSKVWERHEAETRAAVAEKPKNAESENSKEQLIRRADELAKEKLKRDYGVENPVDLVAESRMPANLTSDQKRAMEQEMTQVLPRVPEYDKRLSTYIAYRRELAQIVDTVAEIRQRGSKPRVIIAADAPAAPEKVDVVHHNPFAPSRIPQPSIARMAIVPPQTEQAYMKELGELWPAIVNGPPEELNLAVPRLNDLLNKLYADSLTVGDVEAETKIVKDFPTAERFVTEHVTKMLRVARLITELGYHEQLDPGGTGSEQTFENRPESREYQLPPSIAKFQQNQALDERDRRRRDAEIERVRNEAMGRGSGSVGNASMPGSAESLKSLLTDLVDDIQIGLTDDAVKILRGMIPDEEVVRATLGGALPADQVSTVNGYYYAKQRALSDAEVMSILAPTRAQKVVEVTAVASDELAKMCPTIDWRKVTRSGATFYRARCITEDLKSCRQYDLAVWTGSRWCCLGRSWEVLQQ